MHMDLCLVCTVNFRIKFKYRAWVILIRIITRGDFTGYNVRVICEGGFAGYNVRIITRGDFAVSIIIMLFSRMNFDLY